MLFVADQNENPMAQLGHAYLEFQAGNTGIVVMVSNSPFTINHFQKNNQSTYLILTDKGSKVPAKNFQEKQFFAVRILNIFIVDQNGRLYTPMTRTLSLRSWDTMRF